MIRLNNDYSEGCSPAILAALAAANTEGNGGYSQDPHCAHAADLLRAQIARPDADVHFLSGGTQANLIAIAAALRPHEAAVAADTGHIGSHENGSIEATGHKVLLAPGENGKLTPAALEAVCAANAAEYNPRPRLVYISNTTELGTVYTTAELEALRVVCDKWGLYLFLDGARLGSALACGAVTLPDLGRLCDLFYLGGTKNGALFGEMLVLLNEKLKPDFRCILKQRGGMLAKGFVLGVQFETLLQNNLYLENARHANDLALRVRATLESLGLPLTVDSPSNQQFVLLPDSVLAALEKNFVLEFMAKPNDTHTEVRICTSWATRSEDVDALIAALTAAVQGTR